MHYLFCYDIEDDKTRRRIHQALCDLGEPVQYSAAVLEIRQDYAQKLMSILQPLLANGDSLRCYPLCRRCRETTQHLGKASADSVDPDFFWSD